MPYSYNCNAWLPRIEEVCGMALSEIDRHQRREVVRSRSTRASSPGITLKWPLYKLSHHHFTLAQLGGLSEILPGDREQRLATTGIRARVRHPVYLGHLCEMLAWSFGTGLAVCWALLAFAVITGATMIHMEDKELEIRFGEQYRTYRLAVPALVPKVKL